MPDKQFTELSKQVADIGNQILKLYEHMEQRFEQVDQRFEDLDALNRLIVRRLDQLDTKIDSKADGERVYNTLDGIVHRLDIDADERAAMSHQLDRHSKWIGQLAKHTGAKLVPEQ